MHDITTWLRSHSLCEVQHSATAVSNCYQIIEALHSTLIFRPPIITPFICSSASWAASGMSYSIKAKPLCLFVMGSHDRFTLLIGPNGMNACFIVSSLISKLMLPTYILKHQCCYMINGHRMRTAVDWRYRKEKTNRPQQSWKKQNLPAHQCKCLLSLNGVLEILHLLKN